MCKVIGIKVLGFIVVFLFTIGTLCRYQPIAKDIEDPKGIANASYIGSVTLCGILLSLIISREDSK